MPPQRRQPEQPPLPRPRSRHLRCHRPCRLPQCCQHLRWRRCWRGHAAHEPRRRRLRQLAVTFQERGWPHSKTLLPRCGRGWMRRPHHQHAKLSGRPTTARMTPPMLRPTSCLSGDWRAGPRVARPPAPRKRASGAGRRVGAAGGGGRMPPRPRRRQPRDEQMAGHLPEHLRCREVEETRVDGHSSRGYGQRVCLGRRNEAFGLALAARPTDAVSLTLSPRRHGSAKNITRIGGLGRV